MDKEKIIGSAGLITNDFISRMDLYPWVCALYIQEEYRGNACGALLLERAKKDAQRQALLTCMLVRTISAFMRYTDSSIPVRGITSGVRAPAYIVQKPPRPYDCGGFSYIKMRILVTGRLSHCPDFRLSMV